MHERVTFFYPRSGTVAEPRLLDATLNGRTAQALMWSRCAPSAGPSRAFFPGRGTAAPSVAELADELFAAGGGLLVAAPTDPAAETTLEIRLARAQGFEPAESLLVLRPGTSPLPRPLAGGRLALANGEHALIPVDRGAESQLGKLHEVLGCLPRELSALILETITQPSLDYRLSVLEEQAGHTPARQARGGAAVASTPPGRVRRLALTPLPAGRLLAAVLLALSLATAVLALAPPITEFLAATERRIETIEQALGRVEEKLGEAEKPQKAEPPPEEKKPPAPAQSRRSSGAGT
jgi:hypothetical protein